MSERCQFEATVFPPRMCTLAEGHGGNCDYESIEAARDRALARPESLTPIQRTVLRAALNAARPPDAGAVGICCLVSWEREARTGVRNG